MMPYAKKSKKGEHFVDINNLLSKKYPISMFDITKVLKTIMFTSVYRVGRIDTI